MLKYPTISETRSTNILLREREIEREKTAGLKGGGGIEGDRELHTATHWQFLIELEDKTTHI